MKNLKFLFLGLALTGLLFTSCEKDENLSVQDEISNEQTKSTTSLKSVSAYKGYAAANYALQHTDATQSMTNYSSYNTQDYKRYAEDAANYVSQCLEAGGLPFKGEHPTSNNNSWWYDGRTSNSTSDDAASASWYNTHRLQAFLVFNHNVAGTYLNSKYNYSSWKNGLQKGDLVFFDYDGNGMLDFVMIVTYSSSSTIKVSSHTKNYKDYNLWYQVEHAMNSNSNCKIKKLEF